MVKYFETSAAVPLAKIQQSTLHKHSYDNYNLCMFEMISILKMLPVPVCCIINLLQTLGDFVSAWFLCVYFSLLRWSLNFVLRSECKHLRRRKSRISIYWVVCAFVVGKKSCVVGKKSCVRWPIRVIHAQRVKSPHNNTKHANKSAIHATISRITPQFHGFTPQFHHSRHNFTIHATISRFTPQFHDSRHNFTIHATKKPLTDHGLNTH
jgi:hypothetical protein